MTTHPFEVASLRTLLRENLALQKEIAHRKKKEEEATSSNKRERVNEQPAVEKKKQRTLYTMAKDLSHNLSGRITSARTTQTSKKDPESRGLLPSTVGAKQANKEALTEPKVRDFVFFSWFCGIWPCF